MKATKLLLAASALAFTSNFAMAETTLNALLMSQAAYSEDDVRAMTKDFEAANPDIKVNVEFVPYESLHDKIIAAAGAGDDGYDVVLFDVIWPAEFATRGILKNVSNRVDKNNRDKIFNGAWTTVEYEGSYYGMPWILDTKYLFYNREILEKAGISNPPATWGQLLEQAKVIKDEKLVKYPLVWSWSQSEAMICDFTTLSSAFGGSFFNAEGKPAFQQGGAKKAVEFMTASLKDGLTNPASTEYFEEDVRRVFANGDAAFALNWTYMNALVNDPKESKVAGKVGVISAPGAKDTSKASAVNGSMGLGIPSNSPHEAEAWKYISYLTSMPVQNSFAKLSLPVWKASYDMQEVVKDQPELINAAKTSLAVMYPRPLVPSYTEVSSVLQKNIHKALLNKATPEEALEAAAKRVERIR